MSDLLVNYSRLASLGQQLADLRGEFRAGQEPIASLLATLSDGHLRGKLKDFSDNWSDERAKLGHNLETASRFAIEAAACYLKGDESLLESFSKRG